MFKIEMPRKKPSTENGQVRVAVLSLAWQPRWWQVRSVTLHRYEELRPTEGGGDHFVPLPLNQARPVRGHVAYIKQYMIRNNKGIYKALNNTE